MNILAIDTSAKVTSVCLFADNKIIATMSINNNLAHSQTLMPMINDIFTCSKFLLSDVDCFAVNIGPGSFTGLRIGIAAIKGLAFSRNIKCIGISSLKSLAYNLINSDCIICPVIDARCNQMYTALFESNGTTLTRLFEDDCLKIDEIYKRLKDYKKPIFFIGDGSVLCYNEINSKLDNVFLCNEICCNTNATSLALLARDADYLSEFIDCDSLIPSYLKLSQAQKERDKMLENQGE